MNASHADVEVIVVVVYSYPLGIKSFYCLVACSSQLSLNSITPMSECVYVCVVDCFHNNRQ